MVVIESGATSAYFFRTSLRLPAIGNHVIGYASMSARWLSSIDANLRRNPMVSGNGRQ
jgi:hypothetical protein